MYQILENPQRVSMADIRSKYDGKWVFIIDREGDWGASDETAIPIVIADRMWEGRETGIYKKYNNDETINSTMGLSLMPRNRSVFGFKEMSWDDYYKLSQKPKYKCGTVRTISESDFTHVS